MFCIKCGKDLSKEAVFCQNCGSKIDKKIPENKEVNSIDKKDNKDKPTRDEYMACTNIKTIDEAKKYLRQLKFLFWGVGIGMLLFGAIPEDINDSVIATMVSVVAILYLSLLIYFVVYCVKVTKKEKETNKMSAAFGLIFAPISWIWFYPAITDPLKIIIGKKEPLAILPVKISKEKSKQNSKKFWRNIKVALIILAVFCFLLIAQLLIKYNG